MTFTVARWSYASSTINEYLDQWTLVHVGVGQMSQIHSVIADLTDYSIIIHQNIGSKYCCLFTPICNLHIRVKIDQVKLIFLIMNLKWNSHRRKSHRG